MSDFVREGYDAVAAAYLEARQDDVHDLPFLDQLAGELAQGDRVLDVGCGSGVPVSAHLVAAGLEVIGIDISDEQLALARRHVPQGTFIRRDMSDLEEREFTVAAVVAFYSLFHTPREGHLSLLETFRTFVPTGGRLLCTFGSTEWEGEEPFFGRPMRWSHFGPKESMSLISKAGFAVEGSEMVEHRFEDEMERHLIVHAVAVDPR